MSDKTPRVLSRLCAPLPRRSRRRDSRSTDFDPDDTAGSNSKRRATICSTPASGARRPAGAPLRPGPLVRAADLPGLDAAGKDGTIKHVMSGLNPQGCEVHASRRRRPKSSTTTSCGARRSKLPRRGHIGIFNRSYYEEMLVVRVHPEILAKQQLPGRAGHAQIWARALRRRRQLRALSLRGRASSSASSSSTSRRTSSGGASSTRLRRAREALEVLVERRARARALRRLPDAYEDAIRHTATPFAPWYVVPADHKWFTRLVVASAVIEAIESLRPDLPDGRCRRRGRSCRWRRPPSKARRSQRGVGASKGPAMSDDGLIDAGRSRRRCGWCGDDPLYVALSRRRMGPARRSTIDACSRRSASRASSRG